MPVCLQRIVQDHPGKSHKLASFPLATVVAGTRRDERFRHAAGHVDKRKTASVMVSACASVEAATALTGFYKP